MCTDIFAPLAPKPLLAWMLDDLKHGECLGIDAGLFFRPAKDDPIRIERYGQLLETPIGVAAGPHTQLTQNILAAWLCGARYIELKTVQILDELHVTKPCIDMRDEGYNCEWSQELKLGASYQEYLKAFVLLYVLRHYLGLPSEVEAGKGPGFIFNMSAGYNLEGITQPAMQQFFARMGNAADDIAALKNELADIYPPARDLPIPSTISNNLTISTMHGCPPGEVENIGRHCITERRLHTTIKLNPTLLGAERLRNILNTRLGYEVEAPDEAFGHDLQWNDGINIINALRTAAAEAGVHFSIKLTNTLETRNHLQNLPKSESMVYMSGRALHPVSVHLAERLQQHFDGALDISFSAGADALNLPDLLACGFAPVTVCSDLLKPGGYGRLKQYLDVLREALRTSDATNLDEWSTQKSGVTLQPALTCLTAYAASTLAANSRYRKAAHPWLGIKTLRALPRFDCASAPCTQTCPTNQKVPRYMDAVTRGDWKTAWRVIIADNPFPNMQGMVCDQPCQTRCTRALIDHPLRIRDIKRAIAQAYTGKNSGLVPADPINLSVAIIGAGPSGLSCARTLALAGARVDMYDAKNLPGGMAAHTIPTFRLDDKGLQHDIDAILALGVRLHGGRRLTVEELTQLRAKHHYVYVATGAPLPLALGIPGEDAHGVYDHLSFLAAVRTSTAPKLGANVLVIGGGNAAMDAARTALRLVGKKGCVTLVYRRTRAQMPVALDELHEALDEGIRLRELCAPEEILVKDGHVTGVRVCHTRLMARASSNQPQADRAQVERLEGDFEDIPADAVIVAIGQRAGDIARAVNPKPNQPRTALSGVYAGGDAARGAASLIQAVADGQKAAENMLTDAGFSVPATALPDVRRIGKSQISALRKAQATRMDTIQLPERPALERLDFLPVLHTLTEEAARHEAARCLQCDVYCGLCVSVCPNRANMLLPSPVRHLSLQTATRQATRQAINTTVLVTHGTRAVLQAWQVVNLADACNECGNCEAFCPSADAPYKVKPRVFLSSALFAAAPDGFYLASPTRLDIRRQNSTARLEANEDGLTYTDAGLQVTFDSDTLQAVQAHILDERRDVPLDDALEAAFLFRLIAGRKPFTMEK